MVIVENLPTFRFCAKILKNFDIRYNNNNKNMEYIKSTGRLGRENSENSEKFLTINKD